jgi:hypothetical protein
MTRASFTTDILKIQFESALIYKLQRKKNLESNVDNTKDTSTNIQLLVIWRVRNFFDSYVDVILVKHSNAIIWDENKLMRLCPMHHIIHKYNGIIKDTWILDDAAMLMTTLELEEGCSIEITISEGIRNEKTRVPLRVPSCIQD